MEIDEIRREANKEFCKEEATNRLSDALGFMWRRELLTRYPAPKTETSFARYAYTWDEKEDSKPVSPITPRIKTLSHYARSITEDDSGITLDFEKFSIFIRPKK